MQNMARATKAEVAAYVVEFPMGTDTGSVTQPAESAAAAVAAVAAGYAHIATCDDDTCGCHNPRLVYLDGFPVAEPVAEHAGNVAYTVTAIA